MRIETQTFDLSQAEIAYLFASSTAQNQAITLSDEALHVVSGFQMAGCRHVVGCLWPSDDRVCLQVAKSFYSELGQGRAASVYLLHLNHRQSPAEASTKELKSHASAIPCPVQQRTKRVLKYGLQIRKKSDLTVSMNFDRICQF
jgi:hypothetical protein